MKAHTTKIIGEGLTYDDVLLIPNYSQVLPREVSIQTKFSRNITLNVPIVSAAMDTVTESHMMRLLDLGQPKCVFGYDGEQLKYSRIHKDSTEVMRVITNNYLIDPGIDGIEDFELIDDE